MDDQIQERRHRTILRRNNGERFGTIMAVTVIAVLIIAGLLFWWWSLGYRADNCHEDDMGRQQQWICDVLRPGRG